MNKQVWERFDPNEQDLVKLEDVAGMKEAKIEVLEFVDFLKNQPKYTQLGARLPKGALLTGPPGCGKTLLAKAVASEAMVPFYFVSGSDFVEIIGGLGAKRIREMFAATRKDAPCIVFIDELDALARKRSEGAAGMENGEAEQTLNQLLIELDGMNTEDGVLVLASTNRTEILDKAVLRPGRFDRQIGVTLPTLEERVEIFNVYLRKLKLEKDAETYSQYLSEYTSGFSGADISNFCNEAALHAGSNKHEFISDENFWHAIERLKFGLKKRGGGSAKPDQKRKFAYHEAGHAIAAWMLEHTDPLLRISIIAYGKSVGSSWYASRDRYLATDGYLADTMCLGLAGRVAEQMVFNQVSTHAEDDLKKVTKIAKDKVEKYGMNDRIGFISFDQNYIKRPYSKQLAREMDMEMKKDIAACYKRTEGILKENEEKLKLLAEELLKKENLTYKDIVGLIGEPKYTDKHMPDATSIFSQRLLKSDKTETEI